MVTPAVGGDWMLATRPLVLMPRPAGRCLLATRLLAVMPESEWLDAAW
ncbi:hypothetical protein GCM10011591_26660 [Nocardia camponoti]|uniref:Uncharacterized protein n=1 Tax=Nocardia camponoti TaxID=1616106 RepID=A0A917VA45_9NOCA|nr:hypothetical protein GCM10011591_26660 [Nocardia camponoti]